MSDAARGPGLDAELALSALCELQLPRIDGSFSGPSSLNSASWSDGFTVDNQGAGIVSNVPFFSALSEPSVTQKYTDTQSTFDQHLTHSVSQPADFVFYDAFSVPTASGDTTTAPSNGLEQWLVAFLDGVGTADQVTCPRLDLQGQHTPAGHAPHGVRRKRPLRSPRTSVIPFDAAGVACPGPSTLAASKSSSAVTSNFTFVLTNGRCPSSRKRRRQEFADEVREIKKMKPSADAISPLIKEANRDLESISVLLGVEKNCLKISEPCKVNGGEKQGICHFDLRHCADAAAIDDHMRECHGAASSYSCPWKKCSYHTATQAHMSQHLFRHIGHYVQCPFSRCKTTLMDESLGRHIRNKHNGDILAVVEGKKESSQVLKHI
ncbi:hypothetical protein FISHEDRAFT_69784 [Fistulina hepatica ATCC 64428]|uniref:C2H2-type domain-containing protein n=1 Tax=Fistulina hepatica ATCC 64428 TaxID=1128425 RepID=A0A0D7AKW3_9AGAR|nr:hypothetical protein FISHEDRAFT_69784 [Fistulina hepatica ATCC 64428]